MIPIGNVFMTSRMAHWINEDPLRSAYVHSALDRHKNGDWGDVSEEDKQTNDLALKINARVVSVYQLPKKKIWIITEADRETTTILFPEDY